MHKSKKKKKKKKKIEIIHLKKATVNKFVVVVSVYFFSVGGPRVQNHNKHNPQ